MPFLAEDPHSGWPHLLYSHSRILAVQLDYTTALNTLQQPASKVIDMTVNENLNGAGSRAALALVFQLCSCGCRVQHRVERSNRW